MACNRVRWVAVTGRSVGALAVLAATAAAAVEPTYTVGPITNISSACSGQNAEVEQAVDPRLPHYVYEEWMGCQGIAFAHSIDGGLTFSDPIAVPGSVGSNVNSWDPAVAVGPDGTVYAAFMLAKGGQWYPVVAASFDHGFTFPQVTSLVPPDQTVRPNAAGESLKVSASACVVPAVTAVSNPKSSPPRAATTVLFKR
jgi:hypothetical protein